MKGIYILIIQVNKAINLNVGAIGNLTFSKSWYIYVGSAQKNLEKRVERHLRREKRLFWHIDYLLNSQAVNVAKVLCREAEKPEECRVAAQIGSQAEAVRGFGCSDCKCSSHLFRLLNEHSLNEVQLGIGDFRSFGRKKMKVKNASS